LSVEYHHAYMLLYGVEGKMRLTNRALSDLFEIPFHRVRRWAKEFLPPDPRAGLRSGIAKSYSLAQAYKILLGGHLVSSLGFSVYEAKKIIQELQPWLEKHGLWPEANPSLPDDSPPIKAYSIDITKYQDNFIFGFEGVVRKELEFHGKYTKVLEEKIYYIVPETALNLIFKSLYRTAGKSKKLEISSFFRHFMKRLLNEEEFYRWLKRSEEIGIPVAVE